jgi:hypothetical protein
MRQRLAGIALAATLTLAGAGVWAQAEADRQLDAAIERLQAALGPQARITVGSRQVDPVTGRARLGDVTIRDGDKTMTLAELWIQDLAATRVGRAEARGIRLQRGKAEITEVARLMVAGLPLPAPGQALDPAALGFDALDLEGLTVRNPADSDVTLGRLSARGYAPASGATPGRLASASLNDLSVESFVPSTPAMRLGRVTVAELALPDFAGTPDPLAFRAASIAVEEFELQDRANATEIGLSRLSLRDWSPGRRTELTVAGLSVETNFGTMGLGKVEMERLGVSGIDAAATVAALMQGQQPPDPTPGVPQVISVEGVEVEMNGETLFEMSRLAVEGGMDGGGRMTGAILLEGLEATIPRGSAPPLEQMGFREIAGGMELRAEGARTGGPLAIAPLRITWTEAGALTLVADFDNMPFLDAGSSMGPERLEAYMKARLVGLTLRWQDQGLLGRALTAQARQQRMPEARLREQWAQMALAAPIPGGPAPGGTAQGGKGAPAAADPFAPMRQAVAGFIRQPGTLEIALRPATPIAFEAMAELGAAGPAAAVQRLGLTVTRQ